MTMNHDYALSTLRAQIQKLDDREREQQAKVDAKFAEAENLAAQLAEVRAQRVALAASIAFLEAPVVDPGVAS